MPLGSGAIPQGMCSCPAFTGWTGPCCSRGHCMTGTDCFANAPVDAGAFDTSDAIPEGYTPDFTAFCQTDAGPVDAGPATATGDIRGVGRWCNGPEVCTPFNNGWQCCSAAMMP